MLNKGAGQYVVPMVCNVQDSQTLRMVVQGLGEGSEERLLKWARGSPLKF